MTNPEFVERLRRTFDQESMADVAKRLDLPHATVRNYYQGRLPAPEVLIKIANTTNVSLNWLLTGRGEMYGPQMPAISLGTYLEEKIGEIVDRKLDIRLSHTAGDLGAAAFDISSAIERFNDPNQVMSEWFAYEKRQYPSDYGVVFFKGWESFSVEQKIAAVTDAKRVLDRSLGSA